MDSENAQLAGALYHTLRAVQRPRKDNGSTRVLRAIVKRSRQEETAARHLWEREWG